MKSLFVAAYPAITFNHLLDVMRLTSLRMAASPLRKARYEWAQALAISLASR